MVQDSGDSEERSGFEWRSPRLFVCYILLVLLLFYYIDYSQFSEKWATTIRLLLPETLTSQTTNMSLATGGSWKAPGPYYVAYPHKYHFVINEPKKCEQEKTFVVLIVPVSPGNAVSRDAIRSTWGTEKLVEDKVVSLLFLLGLPSPKEREKLQESLLQESENYHDLLQSNFLDSYHNLTIKTMVMLEWLTAYCQNASYAMKVDSDVFLNVKVLVKMLLSAPKENYMTGLVTRNGVVLRNPRSKWYLPKKVFAPAIYPPYALGLTYVFSLDLPKKLVEAAQHVKAVYIEDVYLGLCMKHLRISVTNPSDEGLFNLYPVRYNRCRYSKLIATTTRSLRDQIEFWKDLQTPGSPC
ncbi:beta-1,3-galactosyltransferase 2-like [Myxocyprinus asiaticus]|uniref:beta-1,3-galactosyltransferase 2-like n=1 Tax=Myxocyprinus asiaticus TaxID=70543 RepID=UPI002221D367|nr:beta-1,3-galactosyltransferase 2-like [Myxocyprinus asiaticus]